MMLLRHISWKENALPLNAHQGNQIPTTVKENPLNSLPTLTEAGSLWSEWQSSLSAVVA